MSSLPDECLKELQSRRDSLQLELTAYKEKKQAEKLFHDQQTPVETPVDTQTNPLTSMLELETQTVDQQNQASHFAATNSFSDSKSEISSCLDSNYESDNNNGGGSSNLTGNASLSDGFENEQADNYRVLLPSLSVVSLERQMTITNSLVLTNSDDSDVTVNDAPLSAKKKQSEQKLTLDVAAAELSDANSSCKTPTIDSLNANLQSNADSDENRVGSSGSDMQANIKPNVLLRQFSDGYSSSCTPLSASSINSEQPSANPFFQAVTHESSDLKDS